MLCQAAQQLSTDGGGSPHSEIGPSTLRLVLTCVALLNQTFHPARTLCPGTLARHGLKQTCSSELLPQRRADKGTPDHMHPAPPCSHLRMLPLRELSGTPYVSYPNNCHQRLRRSRRARAPPLVAGRLPSRDSSAVRKGS